jgi:DNA ligase-1
MKIQPMLASEIDLTRLNKLKYPLLMSPKYDGIRAIVHNGVVVSRTLKPIPSAWVQKMWGHEEFEGLDGELICGDPTSPSCYRDTYSAVMTHGSNKEVYFYGFDYLREPNKAFLDRRTVLTHLGFIVPQIRAENWEDILRYEDMCISAGYEGIMVRSPYAQYKFGRSTFLEQALLKLKRFKEGEAVIYGAEELMHNDNVATIDARGLTVRSSHQENLRPSGSLGAFLVKDSVTGMDFKIGTGFDAKAREDLWREFLAGKLVGCIVKYKYLDYGKLDRPRHPVFCGFRSKEDL